jgi:hypothetical protein
MKKFLSFLLSIALTAACVPFSLPSAAAESWDVTFTVNVAGYETQPGSTKVVVFTNDSDTERVIRTNVYDFSCRVFIFNAEGRLVYDGNPGSERFEIATSGWSDGVYFLKAHANGKILTQKIVKW